MFSLFSRSLPPEITAELERLQELERHYGPLINLSERVDRLTDDFLSLCDKYEALGARVAEYGPIKLKTASTRSKLAAEVPSE